MKLDQPNPNMGGNSDTGKTAKDFFCFEARSKIIKMVDCTPEEREALKNFMQRASIILRTLSSSQKIDTEALEEFCKKCYYDLVSNFPWINVSPTAHSVLAHCAERITLNHGVGLKDLSEQGLEASHKMVRKARLEAARKDSLAHNLEDAFNVLWRRSDPVIRSYQRELLCSRCYESGHTIRGCPKVKIIQVKNEDDSEVDSFFMDSLDGL